MTVTLSSLFANSVGPANSDIATAVAGAVPTISAINTSVSTYASPYGGTITSLGTQTCTGSATVTFSSLGGYKNLRLFGYNVGSSNNGPLVRINGDTGTNYYKINAVTTSSQGYASGLIELSSSWYHFPDYTNGFYIELDQTASGGYKMGKFWAATSYLNQGQMGTLMWNSTAAITSISVIGNGGNFTSGQVWMVGSA